MFVIGIGNVTECNSSYIFLNNEGKQDRIKATEELLRVILDTASNDYAFYGRMWEVITTEYERLKAEAERKYHFITDEMIAEAFKRDRKEGLELSWSKESHNAECSRQYNRIFGMYEGANLASNRRWEANKLLVQAKNSLKIK